jgi:hypothetical protein
MSKPPNYLDYLVALDDHFLNTNDDYIQDWSAPHRIAHDAGIGHGRSHQPEVSRRAGRLATATALAVAEYVLSARC